MPKTTEQIEKEQELKQKFINAICNICNEDQSTRSCLDESLYGAGLKYAIDSNATASANNSSDEY